MDPITLSAIAGSAASTGGGLINGWRNRKFQTLQNEINWEHAQGVMMKEREWALADRDYANAYNSPQAQMERFKAAGINPRMVMDNGSGEASATVRSTTAPNTNQPAPQNSGEGFENMGRIATALTSFATDILKKNAETENVKANTALLAKEMALKDALRENTEANTVNTNFQTERGKALLPAEQYTQLIQQNKLQAEAVKTFHDDERAAIRATLENQEITQRTINLVQDLVLKKLDAQLKASELITNKYEREKKMMEIQNLKAMWSKINAETIFTKNQTQNQNVTDAQRLFWQTLSGALGKASDKIIPNKYHKTN